MSKLNGMLRSFFARQAAVPLAPTSAGAEVVDLATIRSRLQAEVDLRHPVSGKLLGATVTLASPDHPARRQARMDIARAQREQGEIDDETALELVDDAAVEFLARIIFGWSGIKVDGEPIEYSAAAARALLRQEPMRWLVNQLLNEAARTENFIETSAPA
jgi:hypothetical protein